MHPEIKKFWEDTGFQTEKISLNPNGGPKDAGVYWAIGKYKDPIVTACIMAVTLNDGTNKYKFDGKWYSEPDALRVIKLKVFL